MIDFHSHILPGIDDGAKTVEESISMLKSSYEKGVRITVLTPHFYPKGQESLPPFIQKRQEAYELLKTDIARTFARSGVDAHPVTNARA